MTKTTRAAIVFLVGFAIILSIGAYVRLQARLGELSLIAAARILSCVGPLSMSRLLQAPTDPFSLQDFAGSYYQYGVYYAGVLTINADNSFSLHWTTDIVPHMAYTGKVTYGATGNGRNEQRPPGMPDELIPVKWGQRRYLIANDELDFFCLWINEGWEPRNNQWGTFYLHDGDWNIPVLGNPMLYKGALEFSLIEQSVIED